MCPLAACRKAERKKIDRKFSWIQWARFRSPNVGVYVLPCKNNALRYLAILFWTNKIQCEFVMKYWQIPQWRIQLYGHMVWHLMSTEVESKSLVPQMYTQQGCITWMIINYICNKYFIHADGSARGDLSLSLFFSHIRWVHSILIRYYIQN